MGIKAAPELLGQSSSCWPFSSCLVWVSSWGIVGYKSHHTDPKKHSRAKPSLWQTALSPAHYTHSGFQRSHEDQQDPGNIAVGLTSAVSQRNLVNPVSHGSAWHENILTLCSGSAASTQEHKQCWGKMPGTAWLVMGAAQGRRTGSNIASCKAIREDNLAAAQAKTDNKKISSKGT